MKKTKTIKTVIGIIISLLFLFLAFRNVNFDNVVLTIKKVNVPFLIVPIIFTCIGLCLKTLRWSRLLVPEKGEKFTNLFSVLMIGFFGNNVLPARMGEILRIYVLNKNYGYGKSQTLATIVLERVFDVLVLLCFFGIVLLFAPFPPWVINGGMLVCLGFIGISSFLYLFTHKNKITLIIFNYFANLLPEKVSLRIREILENFNYGLKILKNKKAILLVIIYSISIWLIDFFVVYLILIAFNLNLSILAPAFLSIILTLGMIIPSSPGYIGTYEFLCIISLAPFGVEKELALSISIALHGIMLIVTTVIGVICFWRENLKISEKNKIIMSSELSS